MGSTMQHPSPSFANAASTGAVCVTFIGGPLHLQESSVPYGIRRYWQNSALYEISEADLDANGVIDPNKLRVYFRVVLTQELD